MFRMPMEYFDTKNIIIAIFEIKHNNSLAFIHKLPFVDKDAGVITSENVETEHYYEVMIHSKIIMNAVYTMAKKKIMAREGAILGWEGRILNDKEFG